MADIADNEIIPETAPDAPVYEDAAELTSAAAPPSFNREKVLKTAGISIAAVVLFAFVFSSVRDSRRKNRTDVAEAPSVGVPDAIRRERDAAARRDGTAAGYAEDGGSGIPEVSLEDAPPGGSPGTGYYPYGGSGQAGQAAAGYPDGMPPETPGQAPDGRLPETAIPNGYPPPPAQQQQRYYGGGGSGGNARKPEHSPLVPAVEGGLFASAGGAPDYTRQPDYGAYNPYGQYAAPQAAQPYPAMPAEASPYREQNMQDNKQEFYGGPDGALTVRSGYFLGDNVLWTGTAIPGVLVTAINTDLPGDVVARVTGNIYDSRTGKNLLLPQGTILVARYNSSVSYAQSRVQIVWNFLIRPDGFMLDLEGANGVDEKGMAGLKGDYHENWFQYLKAAGIIAMFTLANAKMTEAAAVKLSEEASQANAQLTAQLGGNIINRALDIQPTVTVDSGERINVMLNKPVFIPPVPDYAAAEKYSRR
jgi:type IV secretory pathway VirB10-like protein